MQMLQVLQPAIPNARIRQFEDLQPMQMLHVLQPAIADLRATEIQNGKIMNPAQAGVPILVVCHSAEIELCRLTVKRQQLNPQEPTGPGWSALHVDSVVRSADEFVDLPHLPEAEGPKSARRNQPPQTDAKDNGDAAPIAGRLLTFSGRISGHDSISGEDRGDLLLADGK